MKHPIRITASCGFQYEIAVNERAIIYNALGFFMCLPHSLFFCVSFCEITNFKGHNSIDKVNVLHIL